MGGITNALEQRLEFSVPIYRESKINRFVTSLAETKDEELILLAQTQFLLEEFHACVDIILLFNIRVYCNLSNLS